MVNEEVLWLSLIKARSCLTVKERTENTRPSKGAVVESHCKTTSLDQRQKKGTRIKLQWEQTKMLKSVKRELVPKGQKKTEERLVCRRVLRGGKDVVGKSKPSNLEWKHLQLYTKNKINNTTTNQSKTTKTKQKKRENVEVCTLGEESNLT